MNDDFDFGSSFDSSIRKFKVSVVGDMAVGKTCFSLRFVKGLFREDHRATISDIETKAVVIDNERVVYQIWDTAGQERFRSLLPLYMKGINGAVIVYDITERASFDHVTIWIAEVRKHSDSDAVILLVGNKLDLVEDGSKAREVDEKDGRALAEESDILFMEASAKTAQNVNEAFIKLGQEMLKRYVTSPPSHAYQVIEANPVPEKRPVRKCCG